MSIKCLTFATLFTWCAGLPAVSMTGLEPDYVSMCALAATDQTAFDNFRSSPACKAVIETMSTDPNMWIFECIRDQYPHLLQYFGQICQDDVVGHPVAFDYPIIGKLSSNTLRYVKFGGDIQAKLGDISKKRILEIGGGYGGQCKILHDIFGYANYTLVDLTPCIALAKRYLSHFSVPNVLYVDSTHLDQLGSYDLVISNFALSEIDRQEQRDYLNKIVDVPFGFFTDRMLRAHRERRLKGTLLKSAVQLDANR